MKPYLSLIIPVYNEGQRLNKTISKAHKFLSQLKKNFELIIVNDGSTDTSQRKINQLIKQYPLLKVITHPINQGKGAALKSGIKAAQGKYIFFTDADLATPLAEIKKALNLLKKGHPFILATRKDSKAKIIVKQPAIREFLGKIFTFLSNSLLNLNVSDVTCGFKAWNKKTAKKIWNKQHIPDWSFDAETIFLARKYNIPITELSIKWKDRPGTKVKLVIDGIKSFAGIIKIRLNDLLGKYD